MSLNNGNNNSLFTEQTASWKADIFWTNKKNSLIIWSLDVHYRSYKSLAIVPVMDHTHPGRSPLLYFEFHFNIILLSTPRSSKYFSCSPHATHAMSIAFFLIRSLG